MSSSHFPPSRSWWDSSVQQRPNIILQTRQSPSGFGGLPSPSDDEGDFSEQSKSKSARQEHSRRAAGLISSTESQLHMMSPISPTRQRVTKACDKCSLHKRKCDGLSPCAQCHRYGVICAYTREQKKRGQKPGQKSNRKRKATTTESNQKSKRRRTVAAYGSKKNVVPVVTSPDSPVGDAEWAWETFSSGEQHLGLNGLDSLQSERSPNSSSDAEYMFDVLVGNNQFEMWDDLSGKLCMGDMEFGMDQPPPTNDEFLDTYHSVAATATDPPFLVQDQMQSPLPCDSGLRYPILKELLPVIQSIVSTTTACDLLEAYFERSPLASFPSSPPFILASIMRRDSTLDSISPRHRSPSLLASMLWISALSPDAMFAASPMARQDVARKLYDVTVSLLQSRLNQLGVSMSRRRCKEQEIAGQSPSSDAFLKSQSGIEAVDLLDDIITLLHLVTVSSAEEYSLTFIDWWDVACTLSLKIGLGTEIETPSKPATTALDGGVEMVDYNTGLASPPLDWPLLEEDCHIRQADNVAGSNFNPLASWEYREERRRVWWLLYCLDRHLALSFNRPLSFHNFQCQRLFHPMEESCWQAGLHGHLQHRQSNGPCSTPQRGPTYKCSGLHFTGFFLPLMNILGYIIQARNSRNGYLHDSFQNGSPMTSDLEAIASMLTSYEKSVFDLVAKLPKSTRNPKPVGAGYSRNSQLSFGNGKPFEEVTIAAYARFVMHVLQVLFRAKWDPTSIFEDQDLWVSSRSFGRAMSSALKATEAMEDILVYDPGLTYMPYFIRAYTVQGSLIPLLALETLGPDCNTSVVRACKTIVKAHEACVMTLDSEFQRIFCRITRSAVSKAREKSEAAYGRPWTWQRDALRRYRWTEGGTGLAAT